MRNINVMFTGDSVTDGGHLRPLGLGMGTLGDSYVSTIFCVNFAKNPVSRIQFYNSATSGDTSRLLKERWDTSVLITPVDYLFIMIGVNDCWRNFDCLPTVDTAPSVTEYRENMVNLIERTIAFGAKPVLVSPYHLETDHSDPMRAMCDQLNTILRELAETYHLHYVDVQGAMDDWANKAHSSYYISGDRVHPKAIGKYVIANAIMESDAWKEILDLESQLEK